MNALKSMFGGRRRREAPSIPVYAIGDIHGRRDLLVRLLNKIHSHCGDRQAELIFLGDYIDRGPDSPGVVDCLLESPRLKRFPCTFLKGNHEATMLDFLRDPEVGPSWVQYGGIETMLAYGVRPPALKNNSEAWAETSQSLAAAIPTHHKRFFSDLTLTAERGDYLFVHAGVDPEKPLKDQTERDLLWIREAFLESSRRHEHVIVHGHTPEPEPVHNARRIGIDTGAYHTGVLTAVYISDTEPEFIST